MATTLLSNPWVASECQSSQGIAVGPPRRCCMTLADDELATRITGESERFLD